jgi:uncharacterized protein
MRRVLILIDINAEVSLIQANGSSIIEPKMPIPGIGWYAACTEPDDLFFGIIQADEQVQQ